LIGAKICKTCEEIAERVVKISDTKTPNAQNHEKYDKLFKLSKKIYDTLQQNNIYKDFYEL